jgi:hypothetical protein
MRGISSIGRSNAELDIQFELDSAIDRIDVQFILDV